LVRAAALPLTGVSGRQFSGRHNMSNFDAALQSAGGTIVSKVEMAPGIYDVQYQPPKGMNREPETKTVYDPEVYSDSQMSSMASEAAARAQINSNQLELQSNK
jgi:filamentous hemagglutinin